MTRGSKHIMDVVLANPEKYYGFLFVYTIIVPTLFCLIIMIGLAGECATINYIQYLTCRCMTCVDCRLYDVCPGNTNVVNQ